MVDGNSFVQGVADSGGPVPVHGTFAPGGGVSALVNTTSASLSVHASVRSGGAAELVWTGVPSTLSQVTSGTQLTAVRLKLSNALFEYADLTHGAVYTGWFEYTDLVRFSSAEPSVVTVGDEGTLTLLNNHETGLELSVGTACPVSYTHLTLPPKA